MRLPMSLSGELMKKLFALTVALILLLSLSSAALAKSQHKGMLFNSIVVLEDETPVIAGITVEKVDAKADFDDGKVVVSIPELGLRASKRIELDDRRESMSLLLDIPGDVSGGYYLRIVVMSDDVKRVRHRLITI
ncbi:hypothetical protein J4470_03000 [Candidatus Woesearchaeota archaeon]|nr:hypothetical protein [Candidatus Woesearchaeota archaeon]